MADIVLEQEHTSIVIPKIEILPVQTLAEVAEFSIDNPDDIYLLDMDGVATLSGMPQKGAEVLAELNSFIVTNRRNSFGERMLRKTHEVLDRLAYVGFEQIFLGQDRQDKFGIFKHFIRNGNQYNSLLDRLEDLLSEEDNKVKAITLVADMSLLMRYIWYPVLLASEKNYLKDVYKDLTRRGIDMSGINLRMIEVVGKHRNDLNLEA